MSEQPIRLIIVSGLSGSGKSVALHALEDFGYFCVDNLPLALLPPFIHTLREQPELYRNVAIGVDARARQTDPDSWTAALRTPPREIRVEVLFFTADDQTLVKRFSETRRRHPLAAARSLGDAIEEEKRLLAGLKQRADAVIDTSRTNVHQLRRRIGKYIGHSGGRQLTAVVLESFAFKHGVPADVDLLFDARCLANPHWHPELRPLTGQAAEVQAFLDQDARVQAFLSDVQGFLHTWLPHYTEQPRGFLTVGIGCTGGRHRSVYLVERLAASVLGAGFKVEVHHRELAA